MRVLVADDHSIVRSGMSHLLSELDSDVEVVGVERFDTARDASIDGSADLIILDLNLPGYNTKKDLESFVTGAAPTPIVIFSTSESLADMRRCLEAGCRAYIPKAMKDEQILGVLCLVLAGGTYVPPYLSGVGDPGGGRAGSRVAADTAVSSLTPRQLEVLDAMAEGLSNQALAEKLEMSSNTVKTHVAAILNTLDVENRTQAVIAYNETRE